MKVLILEDEPIHAKYLTKLLNSISELPNAEIIHATSLEMAYNCYKQFTFDIFFLDLNIFGSDGFHFLDKFPKETMKTIIVSANTDIAIRAFDYGVLDFLEKPVSAKRLRLALERYSLRSKTNQKKTNNQNNIKSRLLQVDIDKLDSRLYELMEVEKVYQNEDLSLETLAEELKLHPRQLSEFLNGVKLTSFNSFLHSYRIKEAKKLLIKYPDRKVSDIGFEVGYKSLSSFYDAFKKEQKITTSEFRKRKFVINLINQNFI